MIEVFAVARGAVGVGAGEDAQQGGGGDVENAFLRGVELVGEGCGGQSVDVGVAQVGCVQPVQHLVVSGADLLHQRSERFVVHQQAGVSVGRQPVVVRTVELPGPIRIRAEYGQSVAELPGAADDEQLVLAVHEIARKRDDGAVFLDGGFDAVGVVRNAGVGQPDDVAGLESGSRQPDLAVGRNLVDGFGRSAADLESGVGGGFVGTAYDADEH